MAAHEPLRRAVALIGAGTQGRRLAFMWSSRGNPVHVIDPQERQLQACIPYVEQLRAASPTPTKRWGEITTSTPSSLSTTLKNAWLVIECVPENLSLKRQVVAQLDESAPHDTIIASNSSSYGISDVIDGLTLRNSRRVMSAHCYWPPETTAIEIMGHRDTDMSLISVVLEQCEAHGFSPFHVRKNSTGYLYNRIWAAIKRETLLVLSEGVGTPQEVDAIFKDVLKTPKGPCEQMDVVGLDVVLDIEKHYADTRGNLPVEAREHLEAMIREGRLGVKSGRGFYDYHKGPSTSQESTSAASPKL